MKKLALITAMLINLFATTKAVANDCEFMGRATTTDQKKMVLDITYKFFELEVEDVLALSIDNYVSWKLNQLNCLADIGHYALVTIESINANEERCTTVLDVYAKDNFVLQFEYWRDYKPRNIQKNCVAETEEQAEMRKACEAKPTCFGPNGEVITKDIYDNCSCKFPEDIIKYEEVQDQYEDFYSKRKSFKKPDYINSPFDK